MHDLQLTSQAISWTTRVLQVWLLDGAKLSALLAEAAQLKLSLMALHESAASVALNIAWIWAALDHRREQKRTALGHCLEEDSEQGEGGSQGQSKESADAQMASQA